MPREVLQCLMRRSTHDDLDVLMLLKNDPAEENIGGDRGPNGGIMFGRRQ